MKLEVIKMPKNIGLLKANKSKQDEFYTQF